MRKLILLILLYSSLAAQDLEIIQDTLKYGKALCYNQHSARDRNGKIHIVFTSQVNSSINSKEIIYAEQYADSFKYTNITFDKSEDNFPQIYIDRNNNVHISFLGKDSIGIFQVKYTNNIKGKFSLPIFITSDAKNKSTPVISASKDIVYFLYYTSSYLENDVYISSYNFIKGKNIAQKILGTGDTNDKINASIATDNKGYIHAVFKSGVKEGGELKYYNNTSGDFSDQNIGYTGSILYPRIFMNKAQEANILFKDANDKRLYFIRKTGREHSDAIAITPPDHNPLSFSNFSIDGRSRIYIAYKTVDLNSNAYYLVHGKDEEFSKPIKIANVKHSEIFESSICINTSGNGEISASVSEFYIESSKPKTSIILFKGYLFGNALISVKNNFIFFNQVRVGENGTRKFIVENTGSSDLIINMAATSDPSFKITMPDSVIIEPDSVKEFSIIFSPDDTVNYIGELKLFTNAANAVSITLFLKGKGIGIPYILSESDSMTFSELNNYSDSLLIINAGTDDLSIDSVWMPSFVSMNDSMISLILPGDSTYLKFYLETTNPEFSTNFIDSLIIYSNDPYDSAKTITIHSAQYSLALTAEEKQENFNILHQNYPNPFNPVTTISFTLTQSAHVTLHIYDALAREIAELLDNDFSAGVHNVVFNGENLSTGVYYYKIQVENGNKAIRNYIDVRKMILVK